MFLKKLQQWSRHSLANSISLQASFIAISGGFWVAAISLSVLYWTQYTSLQKQTQGIVERSVERIERIINVAENASAGLAKSSIITTGILDSNGRNAYLDPFLKNYTLPIRAANGIALCDINGIRLAGTRAGLSDCRSDSPIFKQILIDGKTIRELVLLKNTHLIWTIYQGVALNYTGTVEGVLVTQLDLNDLIAPLPQDFGLEKITLRQNSSPENLISVGPGDTSLSSMVTAKSILFRNSSDSTNLPIEVTIWSHKTPFEGALLPLLLSYGLGVILLVGGVVNVARRRSVQLIDPLVTFRR